MEGTRTSRVGGAVLLAIALIMLVAAPVGAQLQIESKSGDQSIKVGFLVQGRLETLDSVDGNDTSQDLYLRRLRLLAGGQVMKNLSFFFETDSPNLGKGLPDGSKNSGDIFIQDFVLTYTFSRAFKLDGGLLLLPISYNSNVSATALLPPDYGPFSFQASAPTTSRVGRDYGILARGSLLNDHLEYRAGLLQGFRGDDSSEPFRTFARVAWYPFEALTGLFYTGTSLGTKHILSLGASYDVQDDYRSWAVDLFWDRPVGSGDSFTVQLDYLDQDGGDFLPEFRAQVNTLVELGWYFHRLKLSPFVQWARDDFDDGSLADEDRLQVGLAWFVKGHNLNVKLGYGWLQLDDLDDRNQFILQCQVFMF